MEQTFTIKELEQYDGKEGRSAYIAVQNVVYDVTTHSSWKNGRHYRGILAGRDITDDIMMNSPHGPSALDGAPIVGKIVK